MINKFDILYLSLLAVNIPYAAFDLYNHDYFDLLGLPIIAISVNLFFFIHKGGLKRLRMMFDKDYAYLQREKQSWRTGAVVVVDRGAFLSAVERAMLFSPPGYTWQPRDWTRTRIDDLKISLMSDK